MIKRGIWNSLSSYKKIKTAASIRNCLQETMWHINNKYIDMLECVMIKQ